MTPSAWATETAAALDRLSRGTLRRREDLLVLLELAADPAQRSHLDALSFEAKFAVRARRIMERIGPDGEGYGRISAEWSAALGRIAAEARALLSGAPAATREWFDERYLGLTPGALSELLELCHDLSWYKNWRIDAKNRTF